MNKGEITLIIGPMFSGKTTELIRRIKRATIINRKVLCIKYCNDIRFTTEDKIISRDNTSTDAIVSIGNSLEETLKNVDLLPFNIICVDEIQFYIDGAEICDKLANDGYEIIASGLQGTYNRTPFETISKLIPLCETIIQLKALDKISKTECSFTKLLIKPINNKNELIGNDDIYMACNRYNYYL